MKTIENFCKANNLQAVKIRYKYQFGYVKRYVYGIDIINPLTREILVSFEPVYYSNGDKWYLSHVHHNYKGPRYAEKITAKLLSFINPLETSSMHLAEQTKKSK